MKGVRKVLRNNEWTEGKAVPWLPPVELRELPESWVTRDTSDPDRIHELDPPHIQRALKDDQQSAEQKQTRTLPESVFEKYDLWNGPLNQLHVDLIKFKVINNLVRKAMIYAERGASFNLKTLHHLWFPEARLDPRELRDGRPPIRHDRPYHLKDLDLIVDVYNWPPRIVDMLRERNIEVPDVTKLENEIANRTVQVW